MTTCRWAARLVANRCGCTRSSHDGSNTNPQIGAYTPYSDQMIRLVRTLFVRYRIPIYRWLLRIVRDETLAEDLLSDVFLDVWRRAASFEGRASVSTWLLAIARYKALSARRARLDAELDERIEYPHAQTSH
jgi:DNA-directed RNA polymerase specialized sigma24 family protein